MLLYCMMLHDHLQLQSPTHLAHTTSQNSLTSFTENSLILCLASYDIENHVVQMYDKCCTIHFFTSTMYNTLPSNT